MSDFLKRYADIVGAEHVEKLREQGSIAAQIISGRHQKKMSQQDLANAIGVAKSTIARIEGGYTVPRTDTLESISKALEIPLIIGLTAMNLFQKA